MNFLLGLIPIGVMNSKTTTNNDFKIILPIFLLITLVSIITHFSVLSPERISPGFGAEYGNIAASIAEGKGFANVFTENSGPTAWHPPLNVYLIASIFMLFGVKSFASMWVLHLIRNIAYAFVVFFLVKTVDLSGFRKYRWLCAAIYLFLLLFNHQELLRGTDDVYLITFLSTLLIYTVVKLIKNPTNQGFIYLYILAFALPLTAPSMALAFVFLLAGYFAIICFRIFRDAQGQNVLSTIFRQPQVRAIIFSGLIFILTVSAWSYRNYQVFHKFIPIKSNLWVEFYFANVLDDDGLLTKEFYRKHHPYKGAYMLDQYLAKGEMQFVEECKELTQKQLEENPGVYINRIGNRLFNAFVFTDHVQDTNGARINLFTQDELAKMKEDRLLILGHWTSLKMDKQDFIAHIKPVHLKNENAVIDDWTLKKSNHLSRKFNLVHVTLGLMFALVPFLCFLAGLFIKKIRENTVFIVTSFAYFLHLFPYIMVSHSYRYQFVLIGLQTIFIFLIASWIVKIVTDKFSKTRVLQKI